MGLINKVLKFIRKYPATAQAATATLVLVGTAVYADLKNGADFNYWFPGAIAFLGTIVTAGCFSGEVEHYHYIRQRINDEGLDTLVDLTIRNEKYDRLKAIELIAEEDGQSDEFYNIIEKYSSWQRH